MNGKHFLDAAIHYQGGRIMKIANLDILYYLYVISL